IEAHKLPLAKWPSGCLVGRLDRERVFDSPTSRRGGRSTMKQWTKSLWLGSAVILTSLLLVAPVAAQNQGGNNQGGNNQGQNNQGQNNQGGNDQGGKWVPTPEPATLTLIALGGGAAALLRHRISRRRK